MDPHHHSTQLDVRVHEQLLDCGRTYLYAVGVTIGTTETIVNDWQLKTAFLHDASQLDVWRAQCRQAAYNQASEDAAGDSCHGHP